MLDVKKTRQVPTKEERRLMMERATNVAAEENEKQKDLRDAKTARLRALRLSRKSTHSNA